MAGIQGLGPTNFAAPAAGAAAPAGRQRQPETPASFLLSSSRPNMDLFEKGAMDLGKGFGEILGAIFKQIAGGGRWRSPGGAGRSGGRVLLPAGAPAQGDPAQGCRGASLRRAAAGRGRWRRTGADAAKERPLQGARRHRQGP